MDGKRRLCFIWHQGLYYIFRLGKLLNRLNQHRVDSHRFECVLFPAMLKDKGHPFSQHPSAEFTSQKISQDEKSSLTALGVFSIITNVLFPLSGKLDSIMYWLKADWNWKRKNLPENIPTSANRNWSYCSKKCLVSQLFWQVNRHLVKEATIPWKRGSVEIFGGLFSTYQLYDLDYDQLYDLPQLYDLDCFLAYTVMGSCGR